MAIRLKRASYARLAVGLAGLAFPLLASGVAQASLAGAIPATTVGRPDVRSATINPTLGSTGASVCFDKPLNGSFVPGEIVIGGYRAGNVVDATGAATDPTNTNCALVTWPSTIGDINQYTFVELQAGAVHANAGNLGNLLDSTPLSGSTSHAGTTGVTTAPNLVGVLAPSGANQVSNSLTYVFDKSTNVAVPADFFYETAGGNVCTGAATIAGNGTTTITVSFSATTSIAGATCSPATVAGAVRAGILAGGTDALNDLASFNPNVSTVLPNCTSPCATSKPDVVSATLNSDFDHVTYTFDKNVVVVNQTGFQAEFADGKALTSTGATLTAPNQVTASFNGNLSPQAEFGVLAWVSNGAVQASDNPTASGNNLPGSAHIGDNAGAASSGFTTGPEVFGVTMNKSTGAVTVNLDDRVKTVTTGLINLMDVNGNVIAATPTPSFNASAGPGPESILLQYSASTLTNATQVQFLGCPGGACGGSGAFTEPFTATISGSDAKNVSQIVSPVNSGAILRGYRAFKASHHKQHHSKKHHSSKKH